MLRALLIAVVATSLSGCYTMLPLKYITNQICGSSAEHKQELITTVDEEMYPHSPRAGCFAQEKEGK